MGWEERRGHQYFYRKRRRNGRVVSEYVGCGEWVEALASLEMADRMQRAVEREERRDERDQVRADEASLDELTALVDTLTTGCLLAAGYHTHKRTWRRKR
jgi:hypothetical protein